MLPNFTKYKIFVSSPSDAKEECKIITEVIDYWNRINSDHYRVTLEAVLWETHAIPEMGDRPQSIIT